MQWLFDGLYKVGGLAVPDNMLILGCNLSSSYQSYLKAKSKGTKSKGGLQLKMKTMIGIVVGKMVVMPVVGISTAYLLQEFFFDVSDDIAGAFYLVLMIVFLTPTANNVMVMVELSGSGGSQQDIASLIAWQYAVSPITLSIFLSIVVMVASSS